MFGGGEHGAEHVGCSTVVATMGQGSIWLRRDGPGCLIYDNVVAMAGQGTGKSPSRMGPGIRRVGSDGLNTKPKHLGYGIIVAMTGWIAGGWMGPGIHGPASDGGRA